MQALIGKNLKAYEIRELIGHGGFGSVYRAYQASIEREVAIKAILPTYANKPEFIRQFEAEARVIARLEHPFIVPLYDYWREPDAAYLVMRYFAAGSFGKFLDAQKTGLPLKRAAQILEQVTSALDTAHQHDIIHLDIKPDNILMDAQGNAYLGDFGLARSSSEQKASDGSATGSIAYMSPEMLRGERLSPQSDIYSLALVTYEMLVGHHPFVDADTKPLSVNDLLMAQLMDYLPNIEHVPAGVNAALQRASAKDPQDRYPTARQFAQAIRDSLVEENILNPVEIAELEQNLIIANPYKGLEAFGESDAQNFFGRDSLVEELLGRMREHPFLALVGPSGSGKSSVIYAGVLPKLRQGAIKGSENWFILSMKPDRQPMQGLAAALRSIAIRKPENLEDSLRTIGLEASLDTLLPNQPTLLLLIDQFEEVFTQSEDKERQAFLTLLHASTTKPESRIRVLLTLRADFYDRPLLYETFGKLMQAHTQVILPLSSDEIREAIVKPAEGAGLLVEDALVMAILGDVSAEVGALPLLQYALSEVFQRRDGRKLSLAAYQASGGVLGALARRADELYLGLSPESQAIAKQVFLRLLTLGEGTEDTRRRAHLTELNSLASSKADLQAVTDTYGKYRLLSFDRDSESREATVEIAHEALIREWQRLQNWLGENRQDIRLQRLLAASAADWKSSGGDNSYLLRGSRLAQYEDWFGATELSLSQDEQSFLQASIEERKRLDALAEAQKAQEQLLQDKLRQRLQAIIGILVVASIAGIILTGFIYQQSQIAQSERDSAQSLSLSLYAEKAYQDGDSLLGLSLALDAASFPNPPAESYDTLLNLAYAPNLRAVFQPMEASISAMAVSADGQFILLGAGNNPVPRPGPARDGAGNEAPPPPPQGGGQGDGPRLPPWLRMPPADESAFAENLLLLVDSRTGEVLRSFAGHHASIHDVLFLEGNRAASSSSEGLVLVWNLESGEILYQWNVGRSRHISLDTSGELLLVSLNAEPNSNGIHILYDLSTGEEIRRIEPKTSALWGGSLFPDGEHGLSVHWDGVLVVWDVETGAEVARLVAEFDLQRHESYRVEISADGQRIVISGLGESLQIWNWQADTLQAISSPSERPHRIVLDEVGERMIWVTQDGVIDIWDLENGQLERRLSLYGIANDNWVNQFAIDEEGRTAIFGFENGSIEVWDFYTSPNNLVMEMSEYPYTHDAAFTSNDEILLYGGYWRENPGVSPRVIEPRLAIWNLTTNSIEREFLLDDSAAGAMSLEGDFALAASNAQLRGFSAASPNQRSEIFYFNLETGETLWQNSFDENMGGADVAIRPDKPQQVLTVWGRSIRLWDTASGEVLKTYEGHQNNVIHITFSPDGSQFLSSGGEDNKVLLWDVETGEILREFDTELRSELLVFHPNGEMALTARAGNIAVLWNLETGEIVQSFEGHGNFVRDAVFSADATRLWTASENGEIIAWNVESGLEEYRYEVSAAQFWDIDISPNGEFIVGVTSDRLIIWRTNQLSLDEVIEWTNANRFVRPLSAIECQRYHVDCGE